MSLASLGYRQLIGRFYARLEAVTSAAWENDVSVMVDTDQAQEEYKWLGMTPPLREWIGGRQVKGLRDNGITIKNKTYEGTLGFNVDDLRRDKTSQINVRITELADRVAEHWSKLLTDLIVTPGNCYDGTAFFGGSHVEGLSGTQDNDLAAGDVGALDVTTAADPTGTEMRKCILGIVQKMLTWKDDQAEPMNANAKGFMVMVPPNMFNATWEAMNAPIQLDGGASVTNPLLTMDGFSFRPVVNPRLSANTVFYVFRTDGSMKPFIRQSELFETSSDETKVFENNDIRFGVKAIRNVGTAYWQYAAKATLS